MMCSVAGGTIHTLPKEMEELLLADQALVTVWNSLTPLARNEWICYCTSAKKEETQKRRRDRCRASLLAGKKRPCCWPGCPHHRPSAAVWFDGE